MNTKFLETSNGNDSISPKCLHSFMRPSRFHLWFLFYLARAWLVDFCVLALRLAQWCLHELKKIHRATLIKLRSRRVYEDLRIGRHHVQPFEASTTKSGLAPFQFSAM